MKYGICVNDQFDQPQEMVSSAYRENFPRLLKIKQHCDPTNLLTLNANIRAS